MAAGVLAAGLAGGWGYSGQMARELLSARGLVAAIKAATAAAAQRNTRIKIRDGDNLLLVVRPGGGASWVLQYRLAGARRGVTLGAWPALGLRAAREVAAEARALVVRGVDPLEHRAARDTAQAARRAADGDTVRRLLDDWLPRQRISEVYRGNIEAAFAKDVLPAIGAVRPADVSRAQVVAILRGLEARGSLEMLRRVRMWLAQLFEFALACEPARAAANPVPAGRLKAFAQHQAGHFPAITNPADVATLLRAVRAHSQPVVRAGLLLSAYLWVRPSELRLAEWVEFDLAAGRWVIPAARMKLRREHWVPLAPQVVQLLRQHAGVVGDAGRLFPGLRPGKPLSEATLSAALASMGWHGRHTPHGFRAMARTILEEQLGADPRHLEKQLAHEEPNRVSRAYNRAEYWPARVAIMALWADWLDAQT